MRTIEIENAALNITGTAIIPDAVCYVFNPNYVDINFGTYNGVLLLAVSYGTTSYEVEVSLFKGKAKCYISKLMQLLFTDYIATRSLSLTITLKTQNEDTILTETTLALWASLDVGMKFGHYLPFAYDGSKAPKYVREVIWFKNFPFRVSLFRQSQSYNAYGKSDSNAAKMIYQDGVPIWESNDGVSYARARKVPRFVSEETVTESTLQATSNQTIDLGLLREAGLEIDMVETGITDVSQLSEVALEDVVVRSRRSAPSRYTVVSEQEEIYPSEVKSRLDWGDYIESGLDIISYSSIFGGKTGIFELSPLSLFPETTKRLVFTIMKTVPSQAKFDAKFDIIFNEMTDIAYIVKLIVSDDVDGIYLRWIDQYGFWQYFLFSEGKRTSKNKLSSTTVSAEYEKNGLYHEATRNIHVDNTDTIKCCAVNLRKEILAYVETIYKSPHIEMYVGLDYEQNEMWKPVNIVAGSVDIEAKQRLYDYEVSITLPNTASQTI